MPSFLREREAGTDHGSGVQRKFWPWPFFYLFRPLLYEEGEEGHEHHDICVQVVAMQRKTYQIVKVSRYPLFQSIVFWKYIAIEAVFLYGLFSWIDLNSYGCQWRYNQICCSSLLQTTRLKLTTCAFSLQYTRFVVATYWTQKMHRHETKCAIASHRISWGTKHAIISAIWIPTALRRIAARSLQYWKWHTSFGGINLRTISVLSSICFLPNEKMERRPRIRQRNSRPGSFPTGFRLFFCFRFGDGGLSHKDDPLLESTPLGRLSPIFRTPENNGSWCRHDSNVDFFVNSSPKVDLTNPIKISQQKGKIEAKYQILTHPFRNHRIPKSTPYVKPQCGRIYLKPRK